MTATEPLTLTLEEAAQLLGEQGLVLILDGASGAASRWSVRSWSAPRDWMKEELGATWPEVVGAARGRPVVARDDAAELRETAEWSGLLSDALGRCADYLEAVLQTSIDDLEPEEADAFSDAVRTAGSLLARFDGGKPAPKNGDAAELRAALREWREAREAEATAHEAWTNALAAQPPLTKYIDDWQAAKDRLDDAMAALRRLAASEEQP